MLILLDVGGGILTASADEDNLGDLIIFFKGICLLGFKFKTISFEEKS